MSYNTHQPQAIITERLHIRYNDAPYYMSRQTIHHDAANQLFPLLSEIITKYFIQTNTPYIALTTDTANGSMKR